MAHMDRTRFKQLLSLIIKTPLPTFINNKIPIKANYLLKSKLFILNIIHNFL